MLIRAADGSLCDGPFDLTKDPDEIRNLALEPAFEKARAAARAKLADWRARAR